jgi:hypothetical protein
LKTVTLPLLNLITLDDETKRILSLAESRRKLELVRKAILSFATEQGYCLPDSKPAYIPDDKWQKVQQAKNKHRSVNYSYVVAYFWLKSLPEYSYRQKSEIIREAIKSYSLAD